MTLKEADEAAQMLRPVLYNEIEYARISRTGYRYDERGRRFGFVELYHKSGNCIIYADPAFVTLKEGNHGV